MVFVYIYPFTDLKKCSVIYQKNYYVLGKYNFGVKYCFIKVRKYYARLCKYMFQSTERVGFNISRTLVDVDGKLCFSFGILVNKTCPSNSMLFFLSALVVIQVCAVCKIVNKQTHIQTVHTVGSKGP